MPRGTSSKGATSEAGNAPNTPDELAAANAEIKRLRTQLAALNAPGSGTLSPNRLADVLEVLAQRLTRVELPAIPAAPLASSKTTKIPDSLVLTDGKDPTFEN